ncbi:MAG TPA: DUF4129 domain-containing protein, partial [Candidatus Polarisedimenticolia bacterium]|nr:DUF4129 domain-containing protein [Candidatus Polarisedimenticolia bacterium]
ARGAAPASTARARRAAARFLSFEAGWASRGVRRLSGQTPWEFCREIERRGLDPSGAARTFVREYYRERYGS